MAGDPLFLDQELAGDQGGGGGVSVLEEFQQVEAVVGVEFGKSGIVEHGEVEFVERGQQLWIGSAASGDGDIMQQLRESRVQRGGSVAAGRTTSP